MNTESDPRETPQPVFAPDCLKIPVVVGVTGHIDIAEPEEQVLADLAVFWKSVREIVGPDTPIVLLSAIARGADHYVVKSMPAEIKKYCAVLPFDEEEYKKDFLPDAVEEFTNDLAGSFKAVQCAAEPGNYTRASDYVRSRSDILITLWDGYESLDKGGRPKKGGTYHQIRTAFCLDDLLIHHQEKKHLVVNLTVSRKNQHKENESQVCVFPGKSRLNVIGWDSVTGKFTAEPLAGWIADFRKTPAPELFWIDSGNDSVKNISIVLKRIRSYNGQNFRKTEDKYLLQDLKGYPRDLQIIHDDFVRYSYFDKDATDHQDRHKSQFARIAVLSIVVGILSQAWGGFTFSRTDVIHEWIMHGVILLFLLGSFLVFLLDRRRSRQKHYEKYVQPRVIAELMRLKMFWKLAGIEESFVDHILKDSGNYWFALPVCNWEILDAQLNGEDGKYIKTGGGLKAVRKCWLENQKGYYEGFLLSDPKHFFKPQPEEKCKAKTFMSPGWCKKYFKIYERRYGYFSVLKTVFTWFGFIFAAFLIAVYAAALFLGFDQTEFLGLFFYREFMVGICPFIVMAFGWLLELNNWNALGRQYRQMRDLFQKAISIFDGRGIKEDGKAVTDLTAGDLEICRRTVKELMLFCHEENAEWKDIKSESKPEPLK